MKTTIEVSAPIVRTARLAQAQGMFDVPPATESKRVWEVNLPIEERDWNIGLVVGPSGCGKSTMARNLWPAEFSAAYEWSKEKSILDGFPVEMGIKDIIEVMSGVGFSSPPDWFKPFHLLSNGQQFRVTMARALAESAMKGPGHLTVVDEFTSVIDRTVAQIGSCAISKAIRRRNQKFIAVGCHEDVEAWLNPDWIFRPESGEFQWRAVRPRPAIDIEVRRVHWSAWKKFHRFHYLTADINKAAFCFVAFWRGQPVAFDAWLPFFGKLKTAQQARRGHRTVCLPDFQGVGIGAALFAHLASMWAGLGYRAFSATAHPAEIAARRRNPNWHMTRAPSFTAKDTGKMAGTRMSAMRASQRLTASFEWCGPKMSREQATLQLNTWATIR